MKDTRPTPRPKSPFKFLKWFCKPDYHLDIEGDLMELFDRRVETVGPKKAKWLLWKDVLLLFRPGIIRPFAIRKFKTSPMLLKNNFKVAWRQLLKQKLYSVVSIGGFALGITACLLISLFIWDELTYDRHIPRANQLYRVLDIDKDDGEAGVSFPAPFAKVLKEDYPEILQAGRLNSQNLFGAGSKQVRRINTDRNTYEEGFIYIDQELLDMFQVQMIYGDLQHALDEPNTIVISKRKADKYFPGENPVGKTLILNDNAAEPYKIGGVMQNFPSKSHLQYDFLMTMTGVEFWPGEQEYWRASNYHTYVLLHPDADVAQLEQKIGGIIENYYLTSWVRAGTDPANAKEMAESFYFELQPVKDIYLKSDRIHDRLSHGDIRFVRLFGAIAVLILFIACINFINLSTARSANRAKEVGLKKVVGSLRSQLISQFLIESVFFSVLSLGLGLLLAQLLLPHFNILAGKSLALPWKEWWYIPLLSLVTVAIGLLAGFYPALHLSSFKPINALKGNLSNGRMNSLSLRSVLVVFQFTISILLILGTFIISRQMQYILNKKLGFEKDQVILLQETNTLRDQIHAFKMELLKIPQVKNVSISDYLPIEDTKRNGNAFWKDGREIEDKPITGQIWRVDHDYINTMGMNIIEGRGFSTDIPTDSQAIIINLAMKEKLSIEAPIDHRITNSEMVWPIIGVIDNFHFQSLRDEIQPLCLVLGKSPSTISVKVGSSDIPELIQNISSTWDNFSQNQPIRYTFLDESFAAMYNDVQRVERIFKSFTLLAIIIASLGLFALSTYMAEQRRKEIGIRKVLGASVQGIIRLLTQSFFKPVFVSILIALPAGWYLMQKWLQGFAYRTEITWDIFIFTGLLALSVAILATSYRAIQAAVNNPVNALRNE